ncbi:hypothetical protein PFISCL1PPCAC_16106, partial [Pristionchus fissidentatus]
SSSLPSSPPPAHLSLPPFSRLLDASFLLPLLIYFALFRLAALFVQTHLWQGYQGFKQYRLHNLSICLLHSCLSGGWAFGFFCTHTHVMFSDTIHWFEPWAAHLPIMSIAYFLNDSIDMAQHEISRWTAELFLHHAATIVAFLFAVLPKKFVPYAYWALLMEMNSIFLHIRSIMQISGAAISRPSAYSVVKIINIVTFVIFRFAVQGWQIWWGFNTWGGVHPSYTFIALGGGATFLTINSILFYRILSSDGFLGEKLATTVGSARDEQTFVKAIATDDKKKSN